MRVVVAGRTVAVAGANAALKFVAYPISRRAERRGRALLNWVAEVMLPASRQDIADWNRTGRVEDVLPWFADWKFGWLDVPALITGAPQILEYPGDHAARRGRAQLPSVADAVTLVTSGASWRRSG